MKFAILFLACFVSLSCQQGFWPYMGYSPYFSPRLFYWPWGYESQFFQQPESVVINAEENDTDIQARIRGGSSISPQNRWFFQNNLFRPGGNFGTTTVFATSTSTAIVANFLSCIPGNQFSSSISAQATNPCARRRRLVAQIMDALEEAYDAPEEVVPTPVTPVEKTALPAVSTQKPSQPAIESSQEHELNEEQTYIRRERAGYNFVTVSSWITSYSFITTNVKKTYTLASTGGLQCLPPGFVVC